MREKLSILIVEDDRTNRMLLEAMLKKSSLSAGRIDSAASLSEAQAQIAGGDYEAILLDLNLPDSKGMLTLDTVVQDYHGAVIVITGEYHENMGLIAISKGAQDYLLKGKYTVENLEKSIRYSIERRAAQEQARKNKQLFETLIAELPHRILLKDTHSVFLYCNEKFAKSIGSTSDQVIGKTDYDFYPKEAAESYIANDREIMASGETVETLFRYNQEGRERITRLIKTVTKDDRGNVEGVLCVFEDFTSRIQMEESLRQSEERFRLLLSKIEGVSFRCANDKQWTMSAIDEDIFALTGYRASDLLNNSVLSYAELIDPRDAENVKNVIYKAISSHEAYDLEYRILCADGSTIWISEKGFGHYVSDGSLGWIEGVIFDITKRKQAEERIKAANAELEKSNHQLLEAQSQLVQSEKLASIGHLAAGVAHEINNPMAFVLSNFRTLETYIQNLVSLAQQYEQLLCAPESKGDGGKSSMAERIGKIREELNIDFLLDDMKDLFADSNEGMNRIINIVKGLRDFSRIDQPENFSYSNLNDGLKSTLVVARNELKYQVEIHAHYSEIPDVFCNSGQLNQVFLNILVNAAQAIESQGREGKGNIIIRTSCDADYVICQIADDGPGIPPEHLSKIYDPFFTTKPAGKGTGLGLNVSYNIVVNKHKGKLLVDSYVGKGATFTIKIPLSPNSEIPVKEEANYGNENCLVRG